MTTETDWCAMQNFHRNLRILGYLETAFTIDCFLRYVAHERWSKMAIFPNKLLAFRSLAWYEILTPCPSILPHLLSTWVLLRLMHDISHVCESIANPANAFNTTFRASHASTDFCIFQAQKVI